MKALTLTDYIQENIQHDNEFATHYDREKLINEIAVMITSARKEHHMTQAELAKKIGTKQSVISRIENGRGSIIPSIETLAKIGTAFNMSLHLKFQEAH